MYLTGFADEASDSIDGQIQAVKSLGWRNIESRNISGKQIYNLPDAEFYTVVEKLKDSGIQINCIGSAIANWANQITEPFEKTVEETKRAIHSAKILKTKLIRIMSYAVLKDKEPDDQMEQERFRRLREIKKMFDDAGILPVHENCMNYGGMSWKHTLKLLDNVPGLRLVFDTGNCVCSDDRSKPKPYPKQSSWEFYKNVKEHISYIHIKDAVWDKQKQEPTFTYPAEGQAEICRIIKDFLADGYDGGISIEPHLMVIHHENRTGETPEELRASSYIKYGRDMEKILKKIKAELQPAEMKQTIKTKA